MAVRKAASMLAKRGGGRPRKSVEALLVSGSYSRGRLLKRLGIEIAEDAPKEDPAIAARWDDFFEEMQQAQLEHAAYKRACELDEAGKHDQADKVLLKAGIDRDRVEQRRAHVDHMIRTGDM